MTIASIDVDAQKCFTPLCPQELPVSEGHLIAAELNKQAEFADLRIGSKDAHSPHAIWAATADKPQFTPIPQKKHVDMHWNMHAVPGTLGFELLDTLPHPSDYDYFVWKGVEPDMHPYGCCYHDLSETLSTGILEFLTLHHVKTVIMGGLALDYCVKTSALQLRRAGFDVVVNLAACRGIDERSSNQAIADMKQQQIRFIDHTAQLSTL